MKRASLLAFVLTALLATSAFAQNPELKPYGFIKGDMVYATDGVLSFGGASLASPQVATGTELSAIGFTAMHSRFGLKGSIGKDKMKVGGLVELDFFGSGFDTNGKPRIRQAFAWVKCGGLEARFGQQWDLFSANNASTNNTNGNMWFAGNHGFRRAQIQIRYTGASGGFTPMFMLSLGEGAKEGSGLGYDNLAGIPMVQARAAAKIQKKHTVGVSMAYGTFSPNQDSSDLDYNSLGIGADFILGLHKLFNLKGEINMGTNIHNANMFTIVGAGGTDYDRKNMGVWLNIISKISKKFNLVVGFGMDMNQSDDQYLKDIDIDKNMVVYGTLIFPLGHGFSIAAEVMSINTSYQAKTGFTAPDAHSAIVFDVAGKVTF